MKTALVETMANGAEIEKGVLRTSIPQRDSAGTKIGRIQSSRTVYFVKLGGRTIPCNTLAQARAEASK